MYHRVNLTIKKLTPAPMSQDEGISFIWKIFQKADLDFMRKWHDSDTIKPFTWNIEQYSPADFTVSFSSILPDIAKCFKAGCDGLKGKAIQIAGGSTIYIDKSYIIEDIGYIGKSIWLQSISGITLTKRHNHKKDYIRITNNQNIWVERLKNNLLRRTEQFTNNAADNFVEISKLHIEGLANIKYKQASIPVQFAKIKLIGSKNVIETALYGGLGEHTASGFGMVVPA